jgi:hypothetical protein
MLLRVLAACAIVAAVNAAGTFYYRTTLANLWFGGTCAGLEVRPSPDRSNGNLTGFELYLTTVSEVDAHGLSSRTSTLTLNLQRRNLNGK